MSSVLSPSNARATLPLLGRILFDTDPKTLWDRDTATLPRVFRRLRRQYRNFAEKQIAPNSLIADLDPDNFNLKKLFLL